VNFEQIFSECVWVVGEDAGGGSKKKEGECIQVRNPKRLKVE
jgi:hypothetical protein